MIFKKAVSILLAVLMLFSASLVLFSCNNNDGDNEGGDNNGGGNGLNPNEEEKSYLSKVIVPEFKVYTDRNTVNFSEIEYKRPDFTKIQYAFDDVIYLIEKNSVSYEEQLDAVETLEEGYTQILTMHQVTHIHNSRNSADEYWSAEYNYVSTSYPAFAKSVEDLFVAAATSPHAESFEDDYFGDGLIEKYADGGIYTEEAIKYIADETKLENDYQALSPSTVKITFAGQTDIASNIFSFVKHKYGELSSQYSICLGLYDAEYRKLSTELLINLLKVRKLIAGELGYSSYQEYAYEVMGHEYTPEQMEKFLDDTIRYVVPIYNQLYNEFLALYFALTPPGTLTFDALLNNSYYIFKELDPELYDIYCYMLQYSLFDINKKSDGRFEGAYTTYLEEYDAPFIFITGDERTSDYSTLFHEFGHFADGFINYNSSASIDLQEISSQALELIMTEKLGVYATPEDRNFLKYTELTDAMESLIFQGFYAKFETLAYDLHFDEITEESLSQIIIDIAPDFGLNSEYLNNVSAVIIPHIMTYPFYVQSYATAAVPALEMYFMEVETAGKGLSTYKTLIDRTQCGDGFSENLIRAGLTSPFTDNYLKKLAEDIYFAITGAEYSDEFSSSNAA